MKSLFLLFYFIVAFELACGQNVDTVYLCKDKTTYLLFDADVALVNTGNNDFGYKAKSNMLMLKAATEQAKTTDLMVQTKTNTYFWIMKFTANPPKIVYNYRQGEGDKNPSPVDQTAVASIQKNPVPQKLNDVEKGTPNVKPEIKADVESDKNISQKYLKVSPPAYIGVRQSVGNRDSDITNQLVQQKVYYVLNQRQYYKDIGEKANSIYFTLLDLYVDKNFIYIKMSLYNTSSIAFDLDFMSFERKSGKRLKKREAVGQNLLPFQMKESVKTVGPSGEEILVYMLKLHAFDEKDRIEVKINELEGGRNLTFDIPAKEIINAKSL